MSGIKKIIKYFKFVIVERPIILFAYIFTILGVGIMAWIITRGFWYEKFINKKLPIDLTKAGVFGDFVGGFIGTIFAFVGILLLYETLKLQRQEFTASKKVFVKQQFDNSFFELLRLYQNIVADIKVTGVVRVIKGKAFFESEKAMLQHAFLSQHVFSYNRRSAVNEYNNFYVSYKSITSVYFKTLYRIYSLIDKSELDENDKITYSKILRAQLSESELFFMRYNAMTEHGSKSILYINKYNILEHLSHFELLEFKDWWSKLDNFERNGLDYLFKDSKNAIKYLIKDSGKQEYRKKLKSGKYILLLRSSLKSEFSIHVIRDISIVNPHKTVVDGFDKFTDHEIENLLECIIKELVVTSNFNSYNNRRNLIFYGKTDINGNISDISAGVSNRQGDEINLTYPNQVNIIRDSNNGWT